MGVLYADQGCGFYYQKNGSSTILQAGWGQDDGFYLACFRASALGVTPGVVVIAIMAVALAGFGRLVICGDWLGLVGVRAALLWPSVARWVPLCGFVFSTFLHFMPSLAAFAAALPDLRLVR